MRCCVPNCKNDSRHISKSQGITYHVFPNEPSLRTAWLKSLGKDEWEPKEHNAVCSEHFLCEDLYETKSGLRKVRVGAVPSILQVCRICLAMDLKLFPIRIYKLAEAYEHLTGISLQEEDRLPQKLCMECALRLLNCSRFRNKTMRANSLMMEIVKKQDHLTLQNIKTINREYNELNSPLSYKHFSPDYCDIYVTEMDQTTPEEIEEHPEENYDLVVKVENEIFLTEDINDKQVKVEVENYVDDDFEMKKVVDSDADDDLDKDFVIALDHNNLSDDSLPLNKCKAKKNKREEETEVEQTVKREKKSVEPAELKIGRRRKPILNKELIETFTVTYLSVDEQVAEILKRQESSNYKNAVFKCKDCFKGFLDKDAYKSHVARHTNQSGEYMCLICKTYFKNPHSMRKHNWSHHTHRFNCKKCTYVTRNREAAVRHERWHSGTTYTCPHCSEVFSIYTTYLGHIRIKHPSEFACGLCGYSFVSVKGIEIHKNMKHRLDNVEIPEDGPFCEPCNVRFVSVEAHSRHLRVSARHNADKDAREANTPQWRKWKEIHRRPLEEAEEPEEPIPCEQCGVPLKNSKAYYAHFRRMHPDKNRTIYPSMKSKSALMCEVCGRICQSYAALKEHTWQHTGERPFKCDSCSKSFRVKNLLLEHQNVHSKERVTYQCTICDKHFSTPRNRQRHMFIHTGLKPFKCEMCDKSFKNSGEKKSHIMYVHLKKPWPKRTRGKRRPDTRQCQSPHQDQGNNVELATPTRSLCVPKLVINKEIIIDATT